MLILFWAMPMVTITFNCNTSFFSLNYNVYMIIFESRILWNDPIISICNIKGNI